MWKPGEFAHAKRLNAEFMFKEAKIDWCHVCGTRAETRFAEAWHPQNAEHPHTPAAYTRICAGCVNLMADGLEDPARD